MTRVVVYTQHWKHTVDDVADPEDFFAEAIRNNRAVIVVRGQSGNTVIVPIDQLHAVELYADGVDK